MSRRYCFLLRVRPDRMDEYRRRHQQVWPEMAHGLSRIERPRRRPDDGSAAGLPIAPCGPLVAQNDPGVATRYPLGHE